MEENRGRGRESEKRCMEGGSEGRRGNSVKEERDAKGRR